MMVSRSLFVPHADGWKVRGVMLKNTLSAFRRLFDMRVVKQSCWAGITALRCLDCSSPHVVDARSTIIEPAGPCDLIYGAKR